METHVLRVRFFGPRNVIIDRNHRSTKACYSNEYDARSEGGSVHEKCQKKVTKFLETVSFKMKVERGCFIFITISFEKLRLLNSKTEF